MLQNVNHRKLWRLTSGHSFKCHKLQCVLCKCDLTSDLSFFVAEIGSAGSLSDSAAIAHVLQRSRRQLKALCLSVRLRVSPKRDSGATLCRLRIIINTHTQWLCVYWHCSAEAVNCVGCRLRSHCQCVSAVGLMASIFTA